MLSAESKDSVPVVDMQNFDNIYLMPGELGCLNSWEFYFQQPGGHSLEEAYAGGGVLFSAGGSAEDVDLFPAGHAWLENAETLAHWRAVYRRHIRLNHETQAHIERTRLQYLSGQGRILGLLCRGTDYNAATARGHAVQPDVEMIIKKAEEMRRAHGCERVYVATEDADILQRLKDHFGGALLHTPSRRISTKQLQTTPLMDKGKANRRADGLNYLTDIALLSHCDCFLAGRVSATPFVFLMRDTPFDAHYIWDLGLYP